MVALVEWGVNKLFALEVHASSDTSWTLLGSLELC
jgi:hypothetical protein